jgi:DNA repair exonuclease SbcCD ATPase subunit
MAERELIVTETPIVPPQEAPQEEAPEAQEAPEPEEGAEPEADATEEGKPEEKRKPGRPSYAEVQERLRKAEYARAQDRARFRRQSQDLQERERQYQERLARIEGHLQAKEQPKTQAEPPIPRFADSPVEVGEILQKKIEQLESARANFERQAAERAQRDQHAQQQESQFKAVRLWVEKNEREYSQINPDYLPATQHLKGVWYAQAEMQFPNATADELENVVRSHAYLIANAAAQAGHDPCEHAYNLAQKMGYRAAVEAKPSPLAQIKAGQTVAKTMSGGGRSVKGPIGFKELGQIRDKKEFEKKFDEMEAETARRLGLNSSS